MSRLSGVATVVFLLLCTGAGAQMIAPLQADEHTLLLYRFESDGATITDEGPLSLSGSIVQGEDREPVDAPERVEGVSGQALTLAPQQMVVLPSNPPELRGMDQLTVELWFRSVNEDPTHRQRIALYWEHYLISVFEGGRLTGHIYDQDATNNPIRGHSPIVPGRWYHSALTYDGERAKLWLNGREEAAVRVTGTINADPGAGLRIGSTGDDWFEGQIDELRISNIARTAFPEARQFDFCRPSETLLISGGTARIIFDPILPEGVSSVACTASLGDVTANATIGEDALKDYSEGTRTGSCEVVLDVPEGLEGSAILRGGLSYEQDGRAITAGRDFPVTVEAMVPPPAVEFRGAWTHSHRMEDPEDLFSRMAAAGLNSAVMRVRRGETAYYASTLGPVSNVPYENEQLLEDCVAACKRHGIDLYCYVNNFPIGSPESEYAQQLRAEGCWQKSATGEDVAWLCPSHPANLDLVEAAMLELVRDYDIAGVQYDFIRYGQADVCFCDRCRAAFEARIGHAVTNWPADCRPEGELYDEWQDQRADLITAAVERTSAAVRAADPDAMISAAVFAMPPEKAKQTVGQEWDLWCREGLLDALCPMSYTPGNAAYEETVGLILEAVGEYLPVYAGIGLRSGSQVMRYPEQLAAKINTARRLGAPGFTMFAITPPTDAPETVIMPLRERMLPGDGREE